MWLQAHLFSWLKNVIDQKQLYIISWIYFVNID